MQLRSLPGELVGQAGLQHETAVKAVDGSVCFLEGPGGFASC